MAKIVTDSQRKREVLYGDELSPAHMAELAREYLESQQTGDAVNFFERSLDEAGLNELKKLAFQEGDSFILAATARASVARGDDPLLVNNEDWKSLAVKARELGKESFALRAEHILRGGDPMGHLTDPDDAAEAAEDGAS